MGRTALAWLSGVSPPIQGPGQFELLPSGRPQWRVFIGTFSTLAAIGAAPSGIRKSKSRLRFQDYERLKTRNCDSASTQSHTRQCDNAAKNQRSFASALDTIHVHAEPTGAAARITRGDAKDVWAERCAGVVRSPRFRIGESSGVGAPLEAERSIITVGIVRQGDDPRCDGGRYFYGDHERASKHRADVHARAHLDERLCVARRRDFGALTASAREREYTEREREAAKN